ncbi:hypothetical protein CTAYLR_005788 [Chrysophaeum taylorii]|uniref:Suppressor of forked domain-containing protein n=1 Tax=Chrysophaeum taylorii TaxID=2483200 RepID=A0AAD7ULW2_9STRA|nr:hypothetical protein CTAYLR_005788 [Chrysophaeum taylorii]
MAYYEAALSELEGCVSSVVDGVDLGGRCARVVRTVASRLRDGEWEESSQRTQVGEAFEVCVDAAGATPWSLALWRAYQSFVESWPLSFDDEVAAARSKRLRRVLERAVVLPIDGVSELWADFAVFEGAEELYAAHEAAAAAVGPRAAAWREGNAVDFEVASGAAPRLVASAYRFQLSRGGDPSPAAWHEFAVWAGRAGPPFSLGAPAPCGPAAAAEIYALALDFYPDNLFLANALAHKLETLGLDPVPVISKSQNPAAPGLLEIFERRRGGKEAARKVFESSRSKPSVVYVAHALVECLANGEASAAALALDKGLLEGFVDDPAYIITYACLLEFYCDDALRADLLLDGVLDEKKPPEGGIRPHDDPPLFDALACVVERSHHPLGPILARMAGKTPAPATDQESFFWHTVSAVTDFTSLDWTWWPDRMPETRFPVALDGTPLRPSLVSELLAYDPVSADETKQKRQNAIPPPTPLGGEEPPPPLRTGPKPLPQALASFCDKLPNIKGLHLPGQRDRIEFVLEALSRAPLDPITANPQPSDASGRHDHLSKPPSDIFRRRRRAQLKNNTTSQLGS